MPNASLKSLQQKLGYVFTRPNLLQQALTHRSAKLEHNERLEFLGDSVLELVIAEHLYQRFPQLNEGQLSRMRSAMVRGETLSSLAQHYAVGEHLILGKGEKKEGGKHRDSTLANAFEAIIGAVFLDAGFEKTQTVVLQWFQPIIDDLEPEATHKDPKSRLQEWLQARDLPLPKYEISHIAGRSHQQIFTVSCIVDGLQTPITHKASNRRKAEQACAEQALAQLESLGQ